MALGVFLVLVGLIAASPLVAAALPNVCSSWNGVDQVTIDTACHQMNATVFASDEIKLRFEYNPTQEKPFEALLTIGECSFRFRSQLVSGAPQIIADGEPVGNTPVSYLAIHDDSITYDKAGTPTALPSCNGTVLQEAKHGGKTTNITIEMQPKAVPEARLVFQGANLSFYPPTAAPSPQQSENGTTTSDDDKKRYHLALIILGAAFLTSVLIGGSTILYISICLVRHDAVGLLKPIGGKKAEKTAATRKPSVVESQSKVVVKRKTKGNPQPSKGMPQAKASGDPLQTPSD
ncbi:hypothetical protein M3Y99_00912300 [Aphelenchoides fujianensis]|nr:hypothetical protein M3Y99_00912300 [Aphelenchoides fujianensis]